MSESLPKFDNPPVVEMVLSAQFAPLGGFSAAHAGLFVRECLEDAATWPTFRDQPALDDQFERFGDESWGQQQQIKLQAIDSSRTLPMRIQIIDANDEHMIQIQHSRFVCNWRKRERDYPSYDQLLPDFRQRIDAFNKLTTEHNLGDLLFNQWEITYVNHIFKRDGLWTSVNDLPQILPGLFGAWLGEANANHAGTQIGIPLENNAGRLRLTVQPIRAGGVKEDEALDLRFTARGPATSRTAILEGLDLGHRAIVSTFVTITSQAAHELWKRTA